MPRKSKTKIAAIDKFVKENYPLHGADFCAEALNETAAYIRTRVKQHKLSRITKRDDKKMVEYVRDLNKALRLEMIKMIMENRRLKMIVKKA